jgi:hypothetical protein
VKTQLDVRRYISAAFRTSRISIVSIIVIVFMTKTTDTSASGKLLELDRYLNGESWRDLSMFDGTSLSAA